MTVIWSFLRHHLTETEAWMLLPVLAAVCMAVGSYFLLQSAVDKRATVTEEEKANWRQQLIDQGKQVVERAQQKAEDDAAETLKNQQKDNQVESATDTAAAAPVDSGLRQRTKGKQSSGNRQQTQSVAADDSGTASDNDWELVDDERIERAEESQFQPPIEYQQAVEKFIEAVLELPATAVDELHTAVKDFFNVLCTLLDGSSHVTPLPSARTSNNDPTVHPQSSPLSPSDRYATRNVLMSRLVDTQSLHALHQIVEAHPGTPLAADAEHLHQLLVPVLHSH